jgi:8-amino-7-oxononanoate synthase
VDFASNDYLGFARCPQLQSQWLAAVNAAAADGSTQHENLLGATGSRLLSGNRTRTMALEAQLAHFFRGEGALLFNSGYTLNSGFFAALAAPGDSIFLDEYAHASLKNGAKLSAAACFYFRHNQPAHLRGKLARLRAKGEQGQVFIVVESVYSMDGDLAPLEELSQLAEEFNAALVVDESHGLGTMGACGRGLVVAQGLEHKVFARIYGFGKGLGIHGAVLVGAAKLMEYMVNFCHSFIYTTALPGFQIMAIELAYRHLQKAGEEISSLHANIGIMNRGLGLSAHPSPIYSIRFSSCEILREVQLIFAAAGIDVFAIYSPTVRRGQERLRLNVHSFNTREEIAQVLALLQQQQGSWHCGEPAAGESPW